MGLSFIDQLTHPDNLYWAWNKAKNQYNFDGGWFNEIELANFEANLENELKRIAEDLKRFEYRISPILPLPYPKKNKETGKQEIRQLFWLSIRDQVSWIAFINVIGPFLDVKMPTWSYGHRLYRPVWIDEELGKKIKRVGWYRHTSGNIYRKFNHSWPLFRRHLFLTIRSMAKYKGYIDMKDKEAEKLERSLPDYLQLIYLKKGFWLHAFDNLFWASIDFKKFYPSIHCEAIKRSIITFLDTFEDEIGDIEAISSQLLEFPIDYSGWSKDDLKEILPEENKKFNGIPTGLFVAGFLSNLAMLAIDRKVDEIVKSKKNIAHLRFVDDHIFIASSFKALTSWISFYEDLIQGFNVGVEINREKTAPIELKQYLKDKRDEKAASESTRLDPKFPSPFMTETLGQISNIARTNFDLLDHNEQRHLMNELEHLLLADFKDEEIREDTRLSFAASRISRFAPRMTRISELKKQYQNEIFEIESYLNGLEKKISKPKSAEKLKKQKIELEKIHRLLKIQQNEYIKVEDEDFLYEKERVFDLLLKAVHEYPDKLRLWTRVLEFCMQTGKFNYRLLINEIKDLKIERSLTCSYLCSYLRQITAKHLIKSVKLVVNKNENLQKRIAAANYIGSLLDFSNNLPKNLSGKAKTKKRYEVLSENLVRCAVGTVELVLRKYQAEDLLFDLISQILKKIRKSAIRRINWQRPAKEWDQSKNYLLADWGWWAINILQNPWDSVPGVVWETVSDVLTRIDNSTWAFLFQFPKYLSASAVKRLLSSYQNRKEYFEKRNFGLLYDITSSSAVEKRKDLQARVKIIEPSVFPPPPESQNITLYEWVSWTAKQYIKDGGPYDPRVSEWTCLRLMELSLKELERLSDSLLEVSKGPQFEYIHPSNFLIPAEWKELSIDKLTWQSWSDKLKENSSLRIKLVNDRIADRRLTVHWDGVSGLESEFAPVRGMGMILLGLLRRSYEWPRVWNPIGLHRAWENLTRKLIQNICCSSRTHGILLACLLSRPRENFYFQKNLFAQPHVPDPEDTLMILPDIFSKEELAAHITTARKVLERHQMSVHGNMPRQLIPIRLEAISDKIWFEEVDAE